MAAEPICGSLADSVTHIRGLEHRLWARWNAIADRVHALDDMAGGREPEDWPYAVLSILLSDTAFGANCRH